MIISIVNQSNLLTDEQVLTAIRAINRQIAEDFEPYWSLPARLRLEGAVGREPDKAHLYEMRGDAVLYLFDQADVQDALGYHDINYRGIPYGFVFTALCKELGENWTVTLSHEALELIGDAQGNLLVQGPHPEAPDKTVYHWFEMCDAVQSQTYLIDNVEVSNFVLPLYFSVGEQEGGRNDFLGRLSHGKGLCSFGVSPGGYIGFFDPEKNVSITYSAPNDKKAQKRIKIKNKYQAGRGYIRKHGDATLTKEDEHKEALTVGAETKSASLANSDPIRHIVVLMLENRSFDHMLGDLTKIYPQVDGIPQTGPKYKNSSSASGRVYEQTPTATESISVDLPHEFTDVQIQLGSVNSHPMGGFVDAYLNVPGISESKVGQVDQVMAYFPLGDEGQPDSLTALHTLARNFLVCDRWFSSMPGPTWPNRFFVHSGTCLGHIHMPSRKTPQYLYKYDQDTVYDRLGDAKQTWRIYHDGIPQSIVLTDLLPEYIGSVVTDKYSDMDDFVEDCKGAEQDFPAYSFIEPCYFGEDENDQHPPTGVTAGEELIAKVYNSIRANDALWKSTLLIVTYDEHGGFYDHVPPPKTVAPDSHTSEYQFDQLGVRVPTILVSPWVQKDICKTTFDHTSILRYVCDKWSMRPLVQRTDPSAGVYQANSFANELTKLTEARTDTPISISARAKPKGLKLVKQTPVEGAREALLYYIATLPDMPADTKALNAKAAKPAQAIKLKKMSDEDLQVFAEEKFNNLRSANHQKKIK